MSKFYQPAVFENTFRCHSHLIVLLFAARRGSAERQFARDWYHKICKDSMGKPRALRLFRVYQCLYVDSYKVVAESWKELRHVPGFLSIEEREVDIWAYRQFLLQWYADHADDYNLEYTLVADPFTVRENMDVHYNLLVDTAGLTLASFPASDLR